MNGSERPGGTRGRPPCGQQRRDGQGMMQQGVGTRREQNKCNREETGRGGEASGVRNMGWGSWLRRTNTAAGVVVCVFSVRVREAIVLVRYGPLYKGCASVYLTCMVCGVVVGVCSSVQWWWSRRASVIIARRLPSCQLRYNTELPALAMSVSNLQVRYFQASHS